MALAGCGGQPDQVISNPFPNPIALTVPRSCGPGYTLRLIPPPEVGVKQGADKSTATLTVRGVPFEATGVVTYGPSPATGLLKDAWTHGTLGHQSGLHFLVTSDLEDVPGGYPMTLAVYQRLVKPDDHNDHAFMGFQFSGALPVDRNDKVEPRKWSRELRAIGQSATFTGIARAQKDC
ncbi:MAG: hypothetical protein QOG62_742 [Thermoleophilaceae bacterium]|nr:hypothetical protein [Thermoleophilaceae bacterium]